MAKIQNISEIHPTLGFTEFDILEKYRKSFNESELGRLHSVFPFEVMAKANEEKSGDKLAGIAAESAEERVAAKVVLSHITLEDLRNNPAVPYEEDEVTRIIQDGVNETIYKEIKGMTVGEFREWLLDTQTTGDMIKRASRGLTSEMVAAVCKHRGNRDLV